MNQLAKGHKGMVSTAHPLATAVFHYMSYNSPLPFHPTPFSRKIRAMKKITISVPATTANLGPGFDCLGMALNLYNTIVFSETDNDQVIIRVDGENADKVPTDKTNLVYKTAEFTFERLGKRPSHNYNIIQHNCIPVGSGLGSSSSAVIAGIMGANALVDGGLDRAGILALANEIEGHPDNVSPAIYGGLTLTLIGLDELHVEQIETPLLKTAVVLPDFEMLTTEARAALPTQVSRADAIFNTSRMGLLVRALAEGDHHKLQIAMQDKIHQPYRLPLIPGSVQAIEAAYGAGATAVALSGAGPSLIAFAPANQEAIGKAMQAAFTEVGLGSRMWVLTAVSQGATAQTKVL